ncbi:mitochondrial import receptor subunit TOM40 homolog [Mya arenaria]|uniref:mitochondrial import receptor subunit TOM40 homolog n=1 Tax=Mya arenaria TaxID=6604 RepID=UPI0022E3F6A4|nr:mitochondrial import receptor subunit TOM40 homolog [Mya arenaria]
MGNSTSSPASAPPPPESPLIIPPPPAQISPAPEQSPASTDLQTIHKEMSDNKNIPNKNGLNPGTYEELHKKTKELFPQVFDGGKILISKPLSSHFQISHSLILANPMTSGYRFGATYAGTKQFSPQEAYPVILGDTDISGNLNANIIHAFTRNTLSRFVAQFQGDKMNTQFVTDFKGSSYTASITAANPDLINASGIVIAHYLQRVTKSLDLGAECMYQRGGQVPGGQIAVMALAARIHGEKRQLSANLIPMGPGGLGGHFTYYHRINEHLQVGAELETSAGMGEAVASVGYQQEIPNAGVNFKGLVDTNLTVQATLEKKMLESQIPITFVLSAFGNPSKSDFKFGVGMMLG